MASVIGWTDADSVDYSIKDGIPYEFIFNGETLLSKEQQIEVDGWKDSLIEFVKKYSLDKESRLGKHAFVYWMEEQGLLKDI